MSLRTRLIVLCAAFLALVVGGSALGAVLVLRANDERREHADLSTAAATAEDLEATYVAQAASIRSYFLTNDTKSFEDYNAQRIHAGDASGRLRGLVMGTPLIDRIERVADAARAWRNDAILPLITLMQQGQSQQVLAQYRDGPAVPYFERVADELSAFRGRLAAAVVAAERAEDAARQRVARFAVGSVVAVILLLGVMSLVGRWWISRPLRQLSLAVRGAADNPVTLPRRGAKEVVTLANDVASLRGRLLDELDLATRTREGLAQNAAVLMSIRAQLETSPDNLPPGWDVAAQLVPATGIVAGDCYTVDVVGRDQMTVVVVDVAGHGANSAILALRAKELLRAAVRSYDDPSDAVTWVSAQLTDLDDDMFVTAFVARLDFATGLVRFVNAGHPEALICDGVNVVELAPTGPLIGPFTGSWTTREAIIGPGQMLVCYTDGLIETRDEDRNEFGLERLHLVLRDTYGDDTDTIVKQCLAEVEAFSHGRAHDDITLAVVARSMD
jgi:serine phosphatase RsbU (regulator of sigma subunit)/CHASE3 domain sensor protein